MVSHGKQYYYSVMELEAYNFARIAHAAVGQVRKYTGDAYIVHPIEVAEIIRSAGGSSEMVQAAYLHDVVEDTSVTIEMIKEEFGDLVARYVDGLTDEFTHPKHGNRAMRKLKERERLANECCEVQTIKLADMISNTRSIVYHDPDFAVVYLKEKEELLRIMNKGNEALHERALIQLANSKFHLGL